MDRIKYTCSNCGWETSVIAQWKDLKPKRCMNKKCNTSFRVSPKSLITKDPTLKPKKAKPAEKKETKSDKKSTSSNKQKTSSKSEQQQEQKTDSE